ncbi:MAG: hypothetical protein V4773_00120 [Verrucomicrobiota bacterium]
MALPKLSALASGGWQWLCSRFSLVKAEASFEAACNDLPLLDADRATELLGLLEQWEAIEAKRGTSEFEPWTLQVLRNDIRRVIAGDPALAALYTRLQHAE